jgi:pimeloyl-ACP methyl ester carboxylesterase
MNDPWLGCDGVREFVAALKDGSLVELPEAGHFPQEHWTQEINESLLPFFRRSDR